MTTEYKPLTHLGNTSQRGDGLQNEDVVGWNEWRAWIIDGGTDVPETRRPASGVSGALWISLRLDAALTAAPRDRTVPTILRDFSTSVRRTLASLDKGDDWVSPICSVAVVERRQSDIIVSRVGDVTVYIPSLHLEVTDNRFGRNERRGVTQDRAAGGSTILQRRRSYISGSEGMWVVGDNPGVSRGVQTTRVSCNSPLDIVLASDGFARAVAPYRIFDTFGDMFQALSSEGPEAVLESIRSLETRKQGQSDHYKNRDDASVLIVRI